MGFGDKLKQLRYSNRLTQQQMSHRLNMEQSNYSKYENNKIAPTADMINRVVSEFKVSSDWLLQPDANHVTFEDGSINNGAVICQNENYYAVPKDLMDTFLEQQKALTSLLQKVLEKL
jgi:transcriptional regulator with XRE-family HTH domain